MSEELKLDRYEVTEGGGTFKCPGGEMVYYSDVKSFIADNNAALRAELAALKAGQGVAVEVVGSLIQGEFFHHVQNGPGNNPLMTVAQHERIVSAITAPPASADAVLVQRELLERLCGATQQSVVPDLATLRTLYVQRMKATDELRALLAQTESKVKP